MECLGMGYFIYEIKIAEWRVSRFTRSIIQYDTTDSSINRIRLRAKTFTLLVLT